MRRESSIRRANQPAAELVPDLFSRTVRQPSSTHPYKHVCTECRVLFRSKCPEALTCSDRCRRVRSRRLRAESLTTAEDG